MIVVEIDGQNAKLVKGKWGGNGVLAPTLEAIGEEYPFKGRGVFPRRRCRRSLFCDEGNGGAGACQVC